MITDPSLPPTVHLPSSAPGSGLISQYVLKSVPFTPLLPFRPRTLHHQPHGHSHGHGHLGLPFHHSCTATASSLLSPESNSALIRVSLGLPRAIYASTRIKCACALFIWSPTARSSVFSPKVFRMVVNTTAPPGSSVRYNSRGPFRGSRKRSRREV